MSLSHVVSACLRKLRRSFHFSFGFTSIAECVTSLLTDIRTLVKIHTCSPTNVNNMIDYFEEKSSEITRCHSRKIDEHNMNIWFYSIFADHSVHAPSYTTDPWNIDFPPDAGYTIKPVDGVFNLFRDSECTDNVNYPYLKMDDFVRDMQTMCAMMADGPLWVGNELFINWIDSLKSPSVLFFINRKSFCYRRLSYLYSKFQLHVLLNELRELASQKAVPHRDFYNIR